MTPTPATPAQADRRARAWDLKAEVYAAWHTEPPRARAAALQLQALAAASPDDVELRALADWGDGIAALAEGQLLPALAALERAQAGFVALADAQHAAETQVPQMVALAMSGRDAEAVARGEQALARFLTVGDQRSAAKVELNLGTMCSRQDRHADAERHFRGAAVRFARAGEVELSIAADGGLAYSLAFQYRFDEAQNINARTRERARTHGYDILYAQALQNTGRIELHRGRWHAALPALAEAAQRMADAGAPPPRRLEAETALADAYLAVSLLSEAVQIYDGVIAQAAALGAPTEEAWATLQRARALERSLDTAGAVAGLSRARSLYATLDNRATMAWCDIGLARVALADGRTSEALATADDAASALAASGITGWWLEAGVLAAAARAECGDHDGAQVAFQALHDQAAELPPVRLACLAGLGRLAAQAGDLNRARLAFTAALDGVDEARAALPDDEFRSALAADAQQVHADLVALSLREGDAARLLDDLERGRARALALSLPTGGAGPLPAETERLRWLRQQWRQAMAEGDAPRLPALAQQMRELERNLLEADRRARLQPVVAPASDNADSIETARPAQVPDGPGEAQPLAAQLVASLPADTAFLIWHRHGDRLVACVATSDGLVHQELPASGLDERLHGLRFQIDTLRQGSAGLQRHAARLMARVRDHAAALHAQLWAPIEPLLGGRRRVVVVPHRELHYLPFGALHDGQHWLVQTHCLSLAPSVRVWLAQQARPTPPVQRVLAMGAGSAGLPQVAEELGAVASVHGPGVVVRLDADASLAAWAAEAPQADILHLACHGRFRADNPAFSFLQLGDGPLTLHDVRSTRLRAQLVVLSACETGHSHVAPGDEVLGLVRAFTLAGAGTVLATLWPVDDGASALLAADFHTALAAGARPAQALQVAQAAAAAAGEHPFHWAAFALHGHG